MIAALYVEKNGAYYGLPDVDPWDEERDARTYTGPHPVVAHPPCQRWGRFWHGSPRKPHRYRKGEDGGCFAAALTAVRNYGGVIEHPKDSHAWDWFGLTKPKMHTRWTKADDFGGWTCCVWQGHYGHAAGKPTWLYAVVDPMWFPSIQWGPCEQRISQRAIDTRGYEWARRQGIMGMIGGKDKTKIRNATPEPFRDLLLSLAKVGKPQGA